MWRTLHSRRERCLPRVRKSGTSDGGCPLGFGVQGFGEVPGAVQGYLAQKKLQPPKDHHRTLGTGLLSDPRRKQFLMREVPMYAEGG